MPRWKAPASGDRITITIRGTVDHIFTDTERRNILVLDYGAASPVNIRLGYLYLDVDARGIQELVNLDDDPARQS